MDFVQSNSSMRRLRQSCKHCETSVTALLDAVKDNQDEQAKEYPKDNYVVDEVAQAEIMESHLAIFM